MSEIQAWIDSGQQHLAGGAFAEALQEFERALAQQPHNAHLRFLCGECLYHLGEYSAVVQVLSGMNTGDDPVLTVEHAITLGRAHQMLGQPEQAEILLIQAFVKAPANPSAAHNLAIFYEAEGRLQEALTFLEAGTRANPDFLPLQYNLGSVLAQLGETDRAIPVLQHVLALNPYHANAHQNLALLHLRQGQFTAGWRHYAWRFNRKQRETRADDSIPATPVLPAQLEGVHIEVMGEQGIGDELFFMRFLPALKRRGARVTYRLENRKLLSLMPYLVDAADCFDGWVQEGADPKPADISLFAGDLPFALGHGDGAPCPPTLRLRPSAETVATLKRRLSILDGPRPRIGLAWRAGTQQVQAGPSSERWLSKVTPLAALLDIIEPLDVDVVVLQRQLQADEIQYLEGRLPGRWLDASGLDVDLGETLALLACLDRLVGVSNTNVHLFAAMGRGGETLVPRPAEFRWLEQGATSPWFPDFGVHRQGPGGDWTPAMASLRENLRQQFPLR